VLGLILTPKTNSIHLGI